MRLYNSLSAAKDEFIIPTNRPVTLYVCGVTPYDTTHIGHAHTFLVFDVLVRYLRWQGAEVAYCQNVTDVDDPLFERAERDGIAWRDLAQREVERFQVDCAALNIVPPTFFPRASEEITTMLPIIEKLIALGHAYVHEGNVYFSVQSDPDFGAMARMGYDDLLSTANQRGNNPDDPHKRDPLDFILWQTGKPGDPTWESPWGMGRPGWHIECSAMATRYLGPQIDIHGGGRDLLFPHHPCEIAQTESVTGLRPFASFWMHAGLIGLDGEKMSKSLGNLVFASDAIRDHGANAVRWYLLSFPYRDDFSYERSDVIRTTATVERLQQALAVGGGRATALDLSRARAAFDAALADDLNTPLALDIIKGMSGDILAAAAEGRDIRAAQTLLQELVDVLGFKR
ncbi:MAG: cysteine--tRNA ligase [Chloroflexales bacterium]|nr:cysteine--tRNA ligase [Chloroflexales bacterium]